MYFIGSAVGLFVSACSVSQKIGSRENQAVATRCVLESVLIRPGEMASLLISLHRCQVNDGSRRFCRSATQCCVAAAVYTQRFPHCHLQESFGKLAGTYSVTTGAFDRSMQRPRKTLGFKTPASELQASVASTI